MSKKIAIIYKILITIAIIFGVAEIAFVTYCFVFYDRVIDKVARKEFAISGGTQMVLEINMDTVPVNARDEVLIETKEKLQKRFDYFGYVPVIDTLKQNNKYQLVLKFIKVEDDKKISNIVSPEYQPLDFRLQELARSEKYEPTGITGALVKKAEVVFDPAHGNPLISIQLDNAGSQLLYDVTKNNANKYIAIYFNSQFLFAPKIMSPISGGNVVIAGIFTLEEAKDLAQKIGDLSGPKISIVSTTYVGSVK